MNNGFRSLAILNDYEKKIKDRFFYNNLQKIYKTPNNYSTINRANLKSAIKNSGNQRSQSPKKDKYYEFNKLPAIVKIMDERNKKEHVIRLNNIDKRKNLYTAGMKRGKDNTNNSISKYSQYYKPIKKENSQFYSRIHNM